MGHVTQDDNPLAPVFNYIITSVLPCLVASGAQFTTLLIICVVYLVVQATGPMYLVLSCTWL